MRQRYYRGRRPRARVLRTLNRVPRRGEFCVGRKPEDTDYPDAQRGDLLPLACFNTLQEALSAEGIPMHQGFTSRHGARRKIVCSKRRRLEIQNLKRPLPRPDGLPVFEVSSCANHTRHPEGWRIPENELGAAVGTTPRVVLVSLAFGVLTGLVTDLITKRLT